MNMTDGDWQLLEQRLSARFDEFGITRMADITGMDILGIPTASVTKTGTRDVIWVYSGKGRTRSQARATAIMECLERTGALWPAEPAWVTDAAAVLERTHEVWGPERFTNRKSPFYDPVDASVWVEATMVGDRERRVMVPADLCFNGHRPMDLVPSPFCVGTSNGLAAGSTRDGALSHAITEILERDVISFAEVRASHLGYRFLSAISERMGLRVDALAGYRDNVDLAATVDENTLPAHLYELVERYRKADVDLVLKTLPNRFGLPAFGVAAVEQVDMTHYLGCAGYAVRTSSVGALESSLLELAQTRATDLQGAREDRHDIEKQRLDARPEDHWLATRGHHPIPFDNVEVDAELDTVVQACARGGLGELAYVEFPGWDGISVVRVFAPDAETWHVTGGWSDIGPRLQRAIGGN